MLRSCIETSIVACVQPGGLSDLERLFPGGSPSPVSPADAGRLFGKTPASGGGSRPPTQAAEAGDQRGPSAAPDRDRAPSTPEDSGSGRPEVSDLDRLFPDSASEVEDEPQARLCLRATQQLVGVRQSGQPPLKLATG